MHISLHSKCSYNIYRNTRLLVIDIQYLATFHRKLFTLERAVPVSTETSDIVASSVEITNTTTTACPLLLWSLEQLSHRVDVSQVGSNDVNIRDATWLSEWRKYTFPVFNVDIETNISVLE